MKKIFFVFTAIILLAFGINAQTKKDGTPDMRYKANKEIYGKKYSSPTYSAPNKINDKNTKHSNNNSTQSVQCSGTTRAGLRCKRMTKSSNGKCYQHGGG